MSDSTVPSGGSAVLVDGPHFKGEDSYLSRDGSNPEAPWPGYGWPLGSTCWYFGLECDGLLLIATGHTVESAWSRAQTLAEKMAEPPSVSEDV